MAVSAALSCTFYVLSIQSCNTHNPNTVLTETAIATTKTTAAAETAAAMVVIAAAAAAASCT